MPTGSRRHQDQPRTLTLSQRFEAAALYGAFALIGAVVFGALTIHPF